MPVFRLSREITFPPPHLAIRDGLLAVGGDLRVKRLVAAYNQGIFPWYAEDDPILWWSPDPRLVLYPQELHISRSLRRILKKGRFSFTLDRAFEDVIRGCAATRGEDHPGTWIVAEMITAYMHLHAAGLAHSVEAWCEGQLAGGLYGISLGRTFFGESMFTRVSNASKAALAVLVQNLRYQAFDLIDCQVTTPHLMQFGAREISRTRFLRELQCSLRQRTIRGAWDFRKGGGVCLA